MMWKELEKDAGSGVEALKLGMAPPVHLYQLSIGACHIFPSLVLRKARH